MRRIALLLLIGLFAVPAAPAATTPLQLTYLDIGSQSQAKLLAADGAGNLFVVSTVVLPSGRPQIGVIKTDPRGNALASFYFGGSSVTFPDTPSGAAVDPQGNIVIVGTTESPDFPLVSPLFSRTTALAGFVVKIDSALQHIIFSTRLGGSMGGGVNQGGTSVNAAAVDESGNIYVTGTTSATDFPVTAGAFQVEPPQNSPFGTAAYAFLTEISAAGDRAIYSTYFGGSNTNCSGGSGCIGAFGATSGTAIATLSGGAAVIAGNTTATNLPVTPGALGEQCSCGATSQAGFVAEFAPGGAKLQWSTYVPLVEIQPPYHSDISILSMTVDAAGNVIIGGAAPPGFPVTSGALQPAYPGGNPFVAPPYAGFLAKLDPSGAQYVFSTYLGGDVSFPPGSANGVKSVAVDAQNGVWATGGSLVSELPLPTGTPGIGQSYVVGLSADGTTLTNSFTAPTAAAGQAIAVTAQGAVAALGSAGSLLIGIPSQGPSLVGVVNSAAFQVRGRVAPYELISLYGIGLRPALPLLGGQVVNGALTTSLGGVQVTFDGIAAPLLFAGPTQINAIVPSSVAGHDSTEVEIVTPGGTSGPVTLFLAPSQPEVFSTAPGLGSSVKAAIAVNQDGTPNSAAHPAAPGSIVTVWATGGGLPDASESDGEIVGSGLASPLLPVAILASPNEADGTLQSLEVLYAGDAPGMVAGVLQVNFRLPEQIQPGTTQLPCALEIGGAISEQFGIYVRP